MNKFLSSKIFLVIVAFVIGILVGWYAWFVVFPNLHVQGSTVWTGTVNHSSTNYPSTTKTKSSSTYKPYNSKTSTPNSSQYTSTPSYNSSTGSSNSSTY